MAEPSPNICAIGLTCPLGADAATALRAYGEGARAFEKARGLYGSDGLSPTLAWVHPFDAPRDFGTRLALLLEGALAEPLAMIGRLTAHRAAIPFAVILPSWLRKTSVPDRIRERIAAITSVRLDGPHFIFGDRNAGLDALIGISGSIVRRRTAIGLIAAVDSFIHPLVLDRLTIDDRIFRAGNPYGVVPGEAASAVLVADEASAGRALPRRGRLRDHRQNREPEDVAAPKCIVGRGLARTLDYGERSDISRLIVDLTGERWRAEEFGFAVAATPTDLTALAADPEAPALAFGDIEAATGLAYLALALGDRAPRASGESGRLTLVSTSSREGGRSSVLVERIPEDQWSPR